MVSVQSVAIVPASISVPKDMQEVIVHKSIMQQSMVIKLLT